MGGGGAVVWMVFVSDSKGRSEVGTPVRGDCEIEGEGMDTSEKRWKGLSKVTDRAERRLGGQKGPTEPKKSRLRGVGGKAR